MSHVGLISSLPGDVWNALVDRIENLVPRDVQGDKPIKATHRKVGPRDVYMVMGAPKNATVEFRAKGRAELWDPWTGAVRPLRVLGETTTGTKVQLPLEDYGNFGGHNTDCAGLGNAPL